MTKLELILLSIITIAVLMSLILSVFYRRAENNEFKRNSKTTTATIYYRAIYDKDIMWNYIRVKFLKKDRQEMVRIKYNFTIEGQVHSAVKWLDLEKESDQLIKHIFTKDKVEIFYIVKKNKVVSRINKNAYLFPK